MDIILIFVIFFALAIGSFLNVLIYRLPRDVNFWGARSICPGCNNQLRWYHNIPLFSYLFLRGRCSFCKEKISIKYPLVELSNVALYLLFYLQNGFTYEFVVYSLISSALLVVFFIDLEFMIIPDSITISGLVVGLAVSFLPQGIGIIDSIIGVLVGGGSLYLVALLGELLFKKESMGGGDIKLTAMLGSFLGWQKMLFIFLSSACIGLVFSIVIMIFSKKLRETRAIPFGPYLAMAAILSITYGNQIIEFYVNNFLYAK